ncbi:hypothetical protein ACET6Q_13200 [Aeromonas dhakensis]|uniref:hypothetical protein n=1 Tax=Aeromonas dhakensis TaxID=196024 RepID=UPI0038D0A145
MKYIEIVNWPLAGSLTVGDDPIQSNGALRVYELISSYAYIDKRVNGIFEGRYKHIAVNDNELFIYDLSANNTVGSLGAYIAYSMISEDNNVRLIEVKV